MGVEDAAWGIALAGEADQTFERLLNELSGYVVELEKTDGRKLDALLIDAHTFQPVDDEGNPVGESLEVGRPQGVYVY